MNNKKAHEARHPDPPAHGYDGSGHMDPRHAKRLMDLGREGKDSDDEAAFIKGSHTQDDLAEALAESAVASMNSGEDELGTNLNAELDEERGGPFVRTAAGTEFAEGTDESNIEDATREAFPTS